MKANLKSLILVFLLALVTSGFSQETSILLKTSDSDISGTLNLPSTTKKLSVVLIIAGSGPTDRNGNNEAMENNSLKMLSEGLAKRNIASVRYDKRGVGKSGSVEETNLRFDVYVNDVKDWINLLSKDARFSKIIIVGHSEGSLLGIIAAEKNKNVKGFVSIAGAGKSADQILKEQFSGVVPDVKEIIYSMLDTLKIGDTIPDVPPIFYSLFRPSIQRYMISWFKYDPAKEIKKLAIPVLIMQGDKDIQVKVEDAKLLSSALPHAKLKIIENMNHVLKECKETDKEIQKATYNNPDLPVKTELIQSLCDFIDKL